MLVAPSSPSEPSAPAPLPKDPAAPAPSPASPTTPDFSSAGEFKGSAGRSNSVFAGTGLGGAVTGDPTVTSVFTPLILPGLFNATSAQSDRKSTRLNSSHGYISYAVFCLKKKKK